MNKWSCVLQWMVIGPSGQTGSHVTATVTMANVCAAGGHVTTQNPAMEAENALASVCELQTVPVCEPLLAYQYM